MIDFEILGPAMNRDRHFSPDFDEFQSFVLSKFFDEIFFSQSDQETAVPYAEKLTLNTHDFIHDDT